MSDSVTAGDAVPAVTLAIRAHLDYRFDAPTDVLVQLEAAALADQAIESAQLDLDVPVTRIAAQCGVGERFWVRPEDRLTIDYAATVILRRATPDWDALPATALRDLPAETVEYLMGSRYCPVDPFERFIEAEFAGTEGGARVAAIRDWIAASFAYEPFVSNADTTALTSFTRRQGVCRDYAHVLIALARASGIPARFASVYAPGVTPPDFHAVAEVFLAGAWQLIDATGMAHAPEMARIGVGRDAADVAFMTSYGMARFQAQSVSVERILTPA
jgi:transglutaminase-like putative cysteine protease